jgi:hypothetical protein
VKVDGDGTAEWMVVYGGDNNQTARSVHQTRDGGFLLSGFVWVGGNMQVMLLKVDGGGRITGSQTTGTTADDYAYCGQPTRDGGFITAGETQYPGISALYLVRFNPQGDTLWTKVHGGDRPCWGSFVQETRDGGFIVAGTKLSQFYELDLWLVKTDAQGETLWTRTFGGTGAEQGNCVRQTTDGGYVIAGYSESFSPERTADAYLVKTDSTGEDIWSTTAGGSNRDIGYSVLQTPDGGYVLTGSTYVSAASYPDLWLVRWEADHPVADIAFFNTPTTAYRGQAHSWRYRLTNLTDSTVVFDWWLAVTGPYQTQNRYVGRKTLGPRGVETGRLRLRVPRGADLGLYSICGALGTWSSLDTWTADCFNCEVVLPSAGDRPGSTAVAAQ